MRGTKTSDEQVVPNQGSKGCGKGVKRKKAGEGDGSCQLCDAEQPPALSGLCTEKQLDTLEPSKMSPGC